MSQGLRAVLLIAYLNLFAANGCHRQVAPEVSMTQEVSPWPVRVGICNVALHLKDAGAQPLTAAHVSLEADMSHPGMAPVFSDATESSPGQYRGHIELTMPGDWVVLVHIRLANGQKAEREIELKGVETK